MIPEFQHQQAGLRKLELLVDPESIAFRKAYTTYVNRFHTNGDTPQSNRSDFLRRMREALELEEIVDNIVNSNREHAIDRELATVALLNKYYPNSTEIFLQGNTGENETYRINHDGTLVTLEQALGAEKPTKEDVNRLASHLINRAANAAHGGSVYRVGRAMHIYINLKRFWMAGAPGSDDLAWANGKSDILTDNEKRIFRAYSARAEARESIVKKAGAIANTYVSRGGNLDATVESVCAVDTEAPEKNVRKTLAANRVAYLQQGMRDLGHANGITAAGLREQLETISEELDWLYDHAGTSKIEQEQTELMLNTLLKASYALELRQIKAEGGCAYSVAKEIIKRQRFLTKQITSNRRRIAKLKSPVHNPPVYVYTG